MTQQVSKQHTPLEHAAKLRVRDRIVALGESLRSASTENRDTIACMLIELASKSEVPNAPETQSNGAAGPVELISRLPNKWRARHADDALLALARAWPNISPSVRPLAVALGRDRWLGTVRELSKEPDPITRLTAIAIAHDTVDPGLSKIVASMLSDEEQRVRRAADETLLRMALKLLDHVPPELLGEEYAKIARQPRIALPVDPAVLALEHCTLYGAISDAAWSFASHRCRSPLIAALLLMDRAVANPLEREIGSRMRRLLSQRNHPSHAPLRSVLKRTDCPLLRERALRWLTISAISSAAIDRLCVAESLTEHEIVLRRVHLIHRPARASRMGTLGNARANTQQRSMFPARELWNQLSESSRCGVITLSSLIGEPDVDRRARIEPAMADESPRVRLTDAALCPMLDLQDYLFDPDPVIARHAAMRWSTLGVEPPRPDSHSGRARLKLAEQNSRSPHTMVRRIAQEEYARLTITDPHSPASRYQARRLLQRDPAGFARLVRDRLSIPANRNDMIMLIRMLGVERRFELDLIGIVQDEHKDERARASAVAALGRIDSNAARYTLSESLSAPDPRTRANAVETAALSSSQLLEYKDDPNHRVRASAVRRTLGDSMNGPGDAARSACLALIDMLNDDRGAHRLAGAWAAQRTLASRNRPAIGLNWSPIIGCLEDLAANDEDPRLRERAARSIERLSRELHSQSDTGLAQAGTVSWG